MLRRTGILTCALVAPLSLAASAQAQEGSPGSTRTPPLAATLGPEGVAEFLRKGAGLINQVEQSVLKRLPDLSY